MLVLSIILGSPPETLGINKGWEKENLPGALIDGKRGRYC